MLTKIQPPFAPFVHPKLPLAARLGLCRGARPSRWPFSPSRRFVPPGQPEISQTRSVWFIVQSQSVLKGRRKPSSFQDGQIHRSHYQPLRSWLISMCRDATHRLSRDETSNAPLPRSSTPNCHWPVLAHGHQLGHCRGARPATVILVGDEVTRLHLKNRGRIWRLLMSSPTD